MQRQHATGADAGTDDGAQHQTTILPRADAGDTAVVCTACRENETQSTDGQPASITRHTCRLCGATGVTERDGTQIRSTGTCRRVPVDPEDPVGQRYYEIIAEDDLLAGLRA